MIISNIVVQLVGELYTQKLMLVVWSRCKSKDEEDGDIASFFFFLNSYSTETICLYYKTNDVS
jgi:hypothetical protein